MADRPSCPCCGDLRRIQPVMMGREVEIDCPLCCESDIPVFGTADADGPFPTAEQTAGGPRQVPASAGTGGDDGDGGDGRD